MAAVYKILPNHIYISSEYSSESTSSNVAMHNLDVRILHLNSLGEAGICSIKISDVKIHQLGGGSHGDETLNALLRDMSTPDEREVLQLRAFVRQHFKGTVID